MGIGWSPARDRRGLSGRLGAQLRLESPLNSTVLTDRRAGWMRWLALGWTVVAALALVGLLAWQGSSFEGWEAWRLAAQAALTGLCVAGGIVGLRREFAGGALALAGASGASILAAIEIPAALAFAALLILLAPALVFWLIWQRSRPASTFLLLAIGAGIALSAGAVGISRAQEIYRSTRPLLYETVHLPARHVDWVLVGGTDTDSTIVKAQLGDDFESVRLAVSNERAFENPAYFAPVTSDDGPDSVVTFQVKGLSPDTQYYYAVEAGGDLDLARRGRLRTFPEGPASFSFAFGSCAETGSDSQVFDTIRETAPLFYLVDGDFHYENIEENDPERFYETYEEVLTSPTQSLLYRSTSFAYTWDDHDYAGNNSNWTSPARKAARQAYRDIVPHYDLPDGDEAIYQAFTVGRVRFIMTDLRSKRDPAGTDDGPKKTMMGTEQKAWFKEQLLDAKDKYAVIVWVSSVPWVADPGWGDDQEDNWGGYADERQEIANFIAEHDIDEKLLMLAGDAHMLAIDDGTNSDYSESGDAGFPVFHAAALDRDGSYKGGPFSEGAHPGSGQFGHVSITDDGGDTIEIELSGRDIDGDEIIGYNFTIDVDSD